ncbi:MAG: metallophosphoesterase [Haloferacaceae archaeon]
MKLGIVSDVHLRSAHERAVLTELDRVVGRLRAFDPDRLVVLGDLIEDETEAADRDHVRAVREALDALSVPVTYLLGNHDVARLSHEDLRDLLGVERFYGRIGGTDLFYLDSSAPERSGAQGAVSDEQLAVLDRELADAEGAVVFVHHPLGYRDLSGNDWFAEEPERAFCGNKREVNEVLARHDVAAVISGHVHETAHVRDRGVEHITVSAFSKERRDVPVTGTYAELTLDDGLSLRVVEGDRMSYGFEFER